MSLYSDLVEFGIDPVFAELACFANQYHDERGRFASAPSGGVLAKGFRPNGTAIGGGVRKYALDKEKQSDITPPEETNSQSGVRTMDTNQVTRVASETAIAKSNSMPKKSHNLKQALKKLDTAISNGWHEQIAKAHAAVANVHKAKVGDPSVPAKDAEVHSDAMMLHMSARNKHREYSVAENEAEQKTRHKQGTLARGL